MSSFARGRPTLQRRLGTEDTQRDRGIHDTQVSSGLAGLLMLCEHCAATNAKELSWSFHVAVR
jgi:hypothetical protein